MIPRVGLSAFVSDIEQKKHSKSKINFPDDAQQNLIPPDFIRYYILGLQ